jgi:hypothetical protein
MVFAFVETYHLAKIVGVAVVGLGLLRLPSCLLLSRKRDLAANRFQHKFAI